jgi:NitT/TauT family transport system substrate-binding protein
VQRVFRRIAVVTTVLVSLYAASAVASEKITIIVGGINKLIYLPPKLAEALGYFRDEGLDVDLQSQQAGVDAENELVAEAAQAVVGFYDHSIDLRQKAKRLRALSCSDLFPAAWKWCARICPRRSETWVTSRAGRSA